MLWHVPYMVMEIVYRVTVYILVVVRIFLVPCMSRVSVFI
jgi:hypothetical protein